ncbi:hypothetical protein HPB48_015395 [Haemaphysalis longicornis]|uniref:Uncharacterized protein n=1 Tax=Haemaphysalis longicornis TaxID=44386 RepID=A0A9J6H2G3_HAELO|nr:hypothetical protein HPB48_015395 [Haemaphysalis longicornis]
MGASFELRSPSLPGLLIQTAPLHRVLDRRPAEFARPARGHRVPRRARSSTQHVLPHVKYDHLQNRVVISVAALQGPLKAADSTPAMLYGGIGFLYARQMLRALDCGGLRIDAQGNVVPQSWASPQWKAASRNRLVLIHGGPLYPLPCSLNRFRLIDLEIVRWLAVRWKLSLEGPSVQS